jgi:hypothetical protein
MSKKNQKKEKENLDVNELFHDDKDGKKKKKEQKLKAKALSDVIESAVRCPWCKGEGEFEESGYFHNPWSRRYRCFYCLGMGLVSIREKMKYVRDGGGAEVYDPDPFDYPKFRTLKYKAEVVINSGIRCERIVDILDKYEKGVLEIDTEINSPLVDEINQDFIDDKIEMVEKIGFLTEEKKERTEEIIQSLVIRDMENRLKVKSNILKILKGKKKTYSEEEIMEITELKWGTVAGALSDLKDQGLIEGWPSSDEVILCSFQ